MGHEVTFIKNQHQGFRVCLDTEGDAKSLMAALAQLIPRENINAGGLPANVHPRYVEDLCAPSETPSENTSSCSTPGIGPLPKPGRCLACETSGSLSSSASSPGRSESESGSGVSPFHRDLSEVIAHRGASRQQKILEIAAQLLANFVSDPDILPSRLAANGGRHQETLFEPALKLAEQFLDYAQAHLDPDFAEVK